uniref:Uncharacterized protein n=1 Tax=Oncorhynchus kisutch TaxID=8019 RepID=A0A8C7MB10_ONCKI
IPGTLPTRLTTILSLLFPVRTLTALLIVMLSKLTPFTSTSLSPTHRPACSLCQVGWGASLHSYARSGSSPDSGWATQGHSELPL